MAASLPAVHWPSSVAQVRKPKAWRFARGSKIVESHEAEAVV
jgi:hypothetical protein